METYKIRASSIAGFFSCPAMWAEIYLAGNHKPATPPAVIGTAVHKSTGEFDKSRLAENSATHISADDAAETLMMHLKDPGEEVDWTGTSIEKAATVALGVHTRYCYEIAPTHTYLAVEEAMDELSVTWAEIGVEIVLTGTLDRRYIKEARIGVADLKTGARACSQSSGKHKAQLGAYELLAEKKTGTLVSQPGELIQLQTSSNYRVAVTPVLNAKVALLGDDHHLGLLTHLARALKAGDFWGNSSSWLCSEKYCPAWHKCIYR